MLKIYQDLYTLSIGANMVYIVPPLQIPQSQLSRSTITTFIFASDTMAEKHPQTMKLYHRRTKNKTGTAVDRTRAFKNSPRTVDPSAARVIARTRRLQ